MSEFKVGDHIVIDQKYDKTFMPVLQILSEGKNYFYCNDGQVHKSQMEQWRKAEPNEIAAGHRIDESVDQVFKDAFEHGHGFAMVSIEGVEHVQVETVEGEYVSPTDYRIIQIEQMKAAIEDQRLHAEEIKARMQANEFRMQQEALFAALSILRR
ncbi:hypothetical protein R4615_05715 [Acinetobacter baumannii]|nr:hypothetical protein [Acinetobacter baumannii]